MAILAQYSTGFSNVLSGTVNSVQVVGPPEIRWERNPITEGQPAVILWNDPTGENFPVNFDIATDPGFSSITTRVVGYSGRVEISLPQGTYFVRGAWGKGGR